jgi:SAM-dependent methyltransferase
VYHLVQRVFDSAKLQAALVNEVAEVKPGERVLDVGCGTGELLERIPSGVQYTGFDLSAAYIEYARQRYAGRGEFSCQDIHDAPIEEQYDLVFAVCVLHHLDDHETVELFRKTAAQLRPHGRVVTADNAWVPEQSRVARFLIGCDRGRNVRTPEGYARLARQQFRDVTYTVRHDLSRFPYTHVFLVCRDPIRPGSA